MIEKAGVSGKWIAAAWLAATVIVDTGVAALILAFGGGAPAALLVGVLAGGAAGTAG